MLKAYAWGDDALKDAWRTLYKGNGSLFPYSSYEYNACVRRYKRLKPGALLDRDLFYVHYDDGGRPMALMPLTRARGGLALFGDNVSGAGNLDFVASPAATDADLLAVLGELAERHRGVTLRLDKLNERSLLCRFLQRNAALLEEKHAMRSEVDRVCVRVPFPKDYDAYYGGLTKNARQNLHKAYNRLRKSSVAVELRVLRGRIRGGVLDDIIRVYTRRESEINHRSAFAQPFKYVKNRYLSALTWAAESMDTHWTFCLCLNGKLAATMTGFGTNFGEIAFPRVAMNSNFAANSPGKLMINESVRYLQRHDAGVAALDLSRGEERYKFEMGGVKHFNYRFALRL